MTSPSAAAARRVVLVPVDGPAERGDVLVRRYRFARMRLEGRDAVRDQRFAPRKRDSL